MPGPAPQPSAVKRARGNPGKRPLNQHEPQPLKGLPSPPEHLSAQARRVWETLGPTLVRNGVMTELDGQAFGDLCETEWLNAWLSRSLAEDGVRPLVEGVTISDGGPEVRKNPLFEMKLAYLKERRMQHARFGMDPASRSRIVAHGAGDVDPLEAFLDARPS